MVYFRQTQASEIWYPGTNKTAILLFHPLMTTPTVFFSLARRFHQQGYSIYCPDFSEQRAVYFDKIARYDSETWYNEVEVALKHIQSTGAEQIVVGGSSLGALMAWQLLWEHMEISAGILLSILFQGGWQIERLEQALLTHFFHEQWGRQAAFSQTAHKKVQERLHQFLVEMNQSPEEIQTATPQLPPPLFIAQGEEDQVAACRYGRDLPFSTEQVIDYHVYPTSDHLLTQGAILSALSRDLQAFLASID
ncbi:MAG: alpha/beta hydrolase [Aerococcus sp.]|nr:alpha/beta hydrolase [Aerococcus sp.]